MPRGFNVCPFFRLFLENAAEKVFSYWRRPGHIIMTLLPWNNARLLSLKKLTAHQMTTKIVGVFIFHKTLFKDSYPTWIQSKSTHICKKSLTNVHHIFETIVKSHLIIPFFEMLIWKICKKPKKMKIAAISVLFFLLKTRVDFFWLRWKDPLFDRIIDLCVDCK